MENDWKKMIWAAITGRCRLLLGDQTLKGRAEESVREKARAKKAAALRQKRKGGGARALALLVCYRLVGTPGRRDIAKGGAWIG